MISAKMAVNGAEKMKGGNMLSVHKTTPRYQTALFFLPELLSKRRNSHKSKEGRGVGTAL